MGRSDYRIRIGIGRTSGAGPASQLALQPFLILGLVVVDVARESQTVGDLNGLVTSSTTFN
jgi:hypothetical protein